MNSCTHDFACDCDDTLDPRVQGAWQDFDEDTSSGRDAGRVTSRPSHTSRGPELGNQQRADHPPVRVLHPHLEQPSDRERAEHRLARQERVARAHLYPVGEVIAMPRCPPIQNDSGPGLHPEAA